MMPPARTNGSRRISQPSRATAPSITSIMTGSHSAGGGMGPRTASCGATAK